MKRKKSKRKGRCDRNRVEKELGGKGRKGEGREE